MISLISKIFNGYRKRIYDNISHNKKRRAFQEFADSIFKKEYSGDAYKGKGKTLIIMVDEFTPKGGLVDKLKGIISAFAIAEILGYQFYILIDQPNFELYKHIKSHFPVYLLDKKNEVVSYHAAHSRPVFIYNYFPKNIKSLLNKLRSIDQIHLYCNVDLLPQLFQIERANASKKWGETFKKLFFFDAAIVKSLRETENTDYKKIGVHFRFMSSLGDFQDSGVDPKMSAMDQDNLMKACKNYLVSLLQIESDKSSYHLFSDSIRFLNFIMNDVYIQSTGMRIYCDTSNIAHTGIANNNEILKRAVLDFYSLGNCSKIYLIKGGGMHDSDFSRYASFINDAPFKLITIT